MHNYNAFYGCIVIFITKIIYPISKNRFSIALPIVYGFNTPWVAIRVLEPQKYDKTQGFSNIKILFDILQTHKTQC